MEEENNIEIKNDKQDSIEVSKTATGKYSWKIKKYFDWDNTDSVQIIADLKKADSVMKEKFER